MSRQSTRELTRRVWLGCIAALVSALVALVLIPSASAFTTNKYWDATMITPDTPVYGIWGDWKRNKIWWNDPPGHIVDLWFDVNDAQWYFKRSKTTSVSPFVADAPSLIHSRGVCKAESNGAQNATCQIFDWYA